MADKPQEVEHPSHYNAHPSGVECIVIAQEFSFCCGSAIKYIWRAGLKDPTDPITDLKKAVSFLLYEIDRLEKKFPQEKPDEPTRP